MVCCLSRGSRLIGTLCCQESSQRTGFVLSAGSFCKNCRGKNINTDSGGLKADGLNHIIIESHDYVITELMRGCRLCGDGVEAFAEPAVD